MRLTHKSHFLRVMKFIEIISQGIGKMMEANGKKNIKADGLFQIKMHSREGLSTFKERN
jgi:hypothetical protein